MLAIRRFLKRSDEDLLDLSDGSVSRREGTDIQHAACCIFESTRMEPKGVLFVIRCDVRRNSGVEIATKSSYCDSRYMIVFICISFTIR